MFSSAKETFEWYANELRKVSEQSARYFLTDPYCKQGYRFEISEVTRLIRNDLEIALYNNQERFNRVEGVSNIVRENLFSTGNLSEVGKYIEEIKFEYESEKLAYSELRRTNKTIYNSTRDFSGEGWIFYKDKSLEIIGGVVQTGFGYISFKMGSKIKSREMKGAGLVGMTIGSGKIYQGFSEIIYEVSDGDINMGGDPVKKQIKKGFMFAGLSEGYSQIGYSAIDMTVSLYNGYAALTKFDPPKRILRLPVETRAGIQRVGFFEGLSIEKGFRLYRWTKYDFKRKIDVDSKSKLIFTTGFNLNKLYLIIDEHKDKFRTSESD